MSVGELSPAATATRSVLRRGVRLLWDSVRVHPRPFVISLVGSVLFGSMAVAGTLVLGEVTDRVIVPGFEEGVSGMTIAVGAAAILGVAVLRSSGVVLRRYFGNMTARGMHRTWFRRITDTYLRAPLEYFGSRPTGQLIAHADADVERAITALMPLPLSLGVVVLVGLSIVSLALVDPLLMLVGLALFPTLALLNHAYSRRVEAPASRTQARLGEVSSVAHESFEGALLVKTLGLEAREVERLAGAARGLRTARLAGGRLRAPFEPVLDALPSLGTVALLAVGAWRVSGGVITTGQLVQAMALFSILTFPMRVVGFLLEEMPRAVVAADRIAVVLAAPARPQAAEGGGVILPGGPLRVDVRALRFPYSPADGAEQRVLDGLDLALAPGEVVAVVGATGSGKSTLCHLLTHLYRPTGGTVRLGGVDLDDAEPASVRRAGGLAFPEGFFFATTVRENLTLGWPGGDEELARVLAVARARRFGDRLPLGPDQPAAEPG